MAHDSRTGVEVKVGFFPLAFFLFACAPRIEIDGQVHKKNWGTHFFPLPTGKHRVRIYFAYLFMPHCGDNSIDVVVEEGRIRKVKYWMPPWMFAKGSLRAE